MKKLENLEKEKKLRQTLEAERQSQELRQVSSMARPQNRMAMSLRESLNFQLQMVIK